MKKTNLHMNHIENSPKIRKEHNIHTLRNLGGLCGHGNPDTLGGNTPTWFTATTKTLLYKTESGGIQP